MSRLVPVQGLRPESRRNVCVLCAGGRTKTHVDAPLPKPSSMIVILVPCRTSLVRQDLLHECLNLRHSLCGVVTKHRRRPSGLIFFKTIDHSSAFPRDSANVRRGL